MVPLCISFLWRLGLTEADVALSTGSGTFPSCFEPGSMKETARRGHPFSAYKNKCGADISLRSLFLFCFFFK